MKPILATLIFALGLGACATHQTTAPTPTHAEAFSGPPFRQVDMPPPPGPGQAREVRVLIDQPALKLATIVLRSGTVLPVHDSAATVQIVALHGAGTVVVGTERQRIDATHSVLLAPRVPHAVEPDPGTDLTLLVYHAHHCAHLEEVHP